MFATRQSIIDQYRNRIACDQRTKLSKNELWDLIRGFIDHLATLKTKAQIKAFCLAEIVLLEEGYPKATVGKVYLPKYRTAIREAIDHDTLPMTKNTSRQYSYQKRNSGESGTAIDHLALDYLKYDQETYEQFAPSTPDRSTVTAPPPELIDDHQSIDHNQPTTPETNPPTSIDNDKFADLQQEITRLWAHINTPPTLQTDELTIALDRITALESRNKSLEQDLSIALRSNLAYQRQLEKLSELLQKPPPPHSKKRTPPATKITDSIDAIMIWNSQNDQKFVISQTLLLKATGCNLKAIKRVMEEHADSIEQHHSQFGILPRHQSKKLNLILDFLDSQNIPAK
jgi:Telomere resolvase